MKKILLLLLIFSAITLRSIASGGCAFTYQADSLNSLSIHITYIGWPGAQTFSYDFGDTTSFDTLQNPTHIYAAPGNYTIRLTIDGGSCNYSLQIAVGGAAACSFINSGGTSAPSNVFFTSTSVGSVVSYSWDFGDGSPVSTLQNASHIYTSPGTYSACLTTQDNLGLTCTTCQNIIVSGRCTANFQYTTSGLTAYFVENSLNTNLSSMTYQWEFGDGDTGMSRYPVHNYFSQGSYNVCLFITDGTCYDTICQTINVDTFPLVGCLAEFLFTELHPYEITIVNTSYGLSPSYSWDFGDGTTSNLEYPSHTYTSTGSYNICLTINDTIGCVNTFCDSLNVDSLGNITGRGVTGFTISVIPPADLNTSITKIENSKLSVYPNPANDFFIVNIEDDTREGNYTLYSLTGNICQSGNLISGKNIIHTMQLSKGMYFLEMRNEKGEINSWKIIKE